MVPAMTHDKKDAIAVKGIRRMAGGSKLTATTWGINRGPFVFI